MTFDDLCQTLSRKNYYIFSLADACVFFPKVKKVQLKQYLSRWKKSGFIAPLRRGLYELVYPKPRVLSDMHFANRIYEPSYVSLETALSHYSLIPEVAMSVLSITSKSTRRFKNTHGLFVYRSVRPEAFCGYTIETHGDVEVFIAEPEKALVDFLYLKTVRKQKYDLSALRLDRKKAAQLNRDKLDQYSRLYGIDVKRMIYVKR